MYILGIDFGTKKLGVAILESDSEISSPLPLIKNDRDLWTSLHKVISDYRITMAVLGLPSYEDTAKKVAAFAKGLKEKFNLDVEFAKEDNTSIVIKKGLTTQKQKQNLDSYSAIEILQQWMSTQKK